MSAPTPLSMWSSGLAEPLFWVQPRRGTLSFALCGGGQTLARLSFSRPAGSLALAETAGERWTFKRVGTFAPRFTARRVGTDENVALFEPGWALRDGRITLAGGCSYGWQEANFWKARYQVSDQAGKQLLLFRPVERKKLSDLVKSQAQVDILPAGSALDELPLLILLGWYVIVLYSEETTTAGVMAAKL